MFAAKPMPVGGRNVKRKEQDVLQELELPN